jgi:hypothetical protein
LRKLGKELFKKLIKLLKGILMPFLRKVSVRVVIGKASVTKKRPM